VAACTILLIGEILRQVDLLEGEMVMVESPTCPTLPEIIAALSGTAPLEQVETLVRHFLTCSACMETLESLHLADSIVERLRSAHARGDSTDRERLDSLIVALGRHAWGSLSSDAVPDTVANPGRRARPADDGWRALLRPATSPDELGWLGEYRVLRLLGCGGMGVVLEAEDHRLKRRVALKVLHGDMLDRPGFRERFVREAQSAAAVKDDHIVTIYQVGQINNVPFLAMEFLPGESLDTRLRRKGRLPLPELLRIARETAEGLATAHDQGLIHRDIKPANIWLESRPGARDSSVTGGRVKILDFGLARAIRTDARLTATGQIVGTPQYMAPEQARGDRVDARADLFSLGCVIYQMATGTQAFGGESVMAVLTALAVKTPEPIARICPDLPATLSTLTDCLLAKEPAERPTSVWEVIEALRAIEQEQPTLVLSPVRAPPAEPQRRLLPRLRAALGAVMRSLGSVFRKPAGKLPAVATGLPIKVGILHSRTGTMALSEKPVIDAVLLAIEEINEQGGVLGRPVAAVIEDGRSDGPTFASKAEKLITQDRVQAVFGCWTSASRKTVKPIIEKHNHLLFYPVQYEGLEQSPNIVYTGAAPNQQIIPVLTWCCSFLKKKRLFLVGSDYVFPRAANAILRDQALLLGAEVVGEEYLLLGSAEVGPIVGKIASVRPDVILNTINGDSNLAFFRTLRAAGIFPAGIPTISFSITEEELGSFHPRDIAGDYAAWNYFQSIDRRQNQAFVARFEKKYGAGRVTTDPMEAAYIGVHLWAQAARQAGSAEPEAVRRTIKNQSHDAPEGPVRIDPDTQHLYKFIRIGRITQEGHFEVVYCSDQAIPPVPYPPTRKKTEWDAYLQDLHLRWGGQWANPGS
jgi:urea transport system substrate-binding protein